MASRFFDALVLVTFGWKSNGQPERHVLYQYKFVNNVSIPPNIAHFCYPEKLLENTSFEPKFEYVYLKL
jgi:hypothetical protein